MKGGGKRKEGGRKGGKERVKDAKIAVCSVLSHAVM